MVGLPGSNEGSSLVTKPRGRLPNEAAPAPTGQASKAKDPQNRTGKTVRVQGWACTLQHRRT